MRHPSPIQTFTVGFGISPNPPLQTNAGHGLRATAHHRRWGISPRPEGYPIQVNSYYLSRNAIVSRFNMFLF